MSPRAGGEPPLYRPEDARRIVESASAELRDLMRRELADDGSSDGLTEQIAALTAKVDALAAAQAPPAGQHPTNASEAQARALATMLAESQSQWFSAGGGTNG